MEVIAGLLAPAHETLDAGGYGMGRSDMLEVAHMRLHVAQMAS